MIYELISDKENKRIFRNKETGTEVKLSKIHTDKEGCHWWGFDDFYKVPIMRMAMAKNITDMYSVGLTLNDIKTWCSEQKTLLKSSDPEKYEKLYAKVLEIERTATFTADPLKQQLALCTVYIIADTERIDYFDEQQAESKLKLWKGSPDMVAFFLTWHTGRIQRYIKDLQGISEIASKLERQQQKLQSNLLGKLESGTGSNNYSSGQ